MYEFTSLYTFLMSIYFVGTDINLFVFTEKCDRLVAQTVEST